MGDQFGRLEDRVTPAFAGGVSVAAGDIDGDGYSDVVTGAGPGGGPHVKVFSGATGQEVASFFAFDPEFLGGVSVALGDVNADGQLDLIAGTETGGSRVRVFDGITLQEVYSVQAYTPQFTGGVSVAAADLDGDGHAEVITGAGLGGGPHVRAFSVVSGAVVRDFMAFDPTFRGGANVAAGDVTGDGVPDIVAGAGPGGGPHVKAFDGTTGDVRMSVFAYEQAFAGGANVAVGDMDGDGAAEVITGAGRGGDPRVRVFHASGEQVASPLGSFYAYATGFRGGVFVATADLDADGKADVVTGTGPGGGPHVRSFHSNGTDGLASFLAYDQVTAGRRFSNEQSKIDPVQILDWNTTLLAAVQSAASAPPVATRAMAILNATVFDVQNALAAKPGYVATLIPPVGGNPTAALAAAAQAALTFALPTQSARFDAELATQLGRIANGAAKDTGVAFGRAVAAAVIDTRRNDGSSQSIDIPSGNGVGEWRPTPPGFAEELLPQWATVTPFALDRPNRFRPDAPPAVGSAEWLADLDEVRRLGRDTSTVRTAEQSDTARLWADGAGTVTPPGHWLQIALDAARATGMDAATTGRMLAALSLALADTSVAAWDAKYTYRTWRPITAIRDGGDPSITTDPTWTPLLITPNHPEYVSGHSSYSRAAATVLEQFFPNYSFTTTGTALGKTVIRKYASFDAAATDAGRSRVFGGIHFEFSNRAGQALGRSVAEYVLGTFGTDTIKPEITFTTPTGQTRDANIAIVGQATDRGGRVTSLTARIDGGAAVAVSIDPTTGGFNFTTSLATDGSADGTHAVAFRATDRGGNVTEATFSFTLRTPTGPDTAPPTVTVTAPVPDQVFAANPTVAGLVTDARSGVARLEVSVDGGPSAPLAVSATGAFSFVTQLPLGGAADGAHRISFVATDKAGNVSPTVRVDFTLLSNTGGGLGDVTAPVVTLSSPPTGELRRTNPTVTGVATDDRAGVALLQVAIDGGGFTDLTRDAAGGFSFTPALPLGGAADGAHTLRFRAIDRAGNISQAVTFAFTLDSASPTVSVGLTNPVRVAPTAITLTFSEAVSGAAGDKASYALTQTGIGAVAVAAVDKLSDTQYSLRLFAPLADAAFTLTVAGGITDTAGNPLGGTTVFPFTVAAPTAISELSPANGEEMVSLTRETIVRFDGAVDPATITPDSFYLIANGERVAGHIRVSPTEKFATFFYDQPLPASTEVRAVVDGNVVTGRDGFAVDADEDGEPGGVGTADFRTLPLTFIPGTRLYGFVYDSYNRDADGNNIPVVGARISLDADPRYFAVTNAQGFFELGLQDVNGDGTPDGLPAPEFFVHIDGSTAINAPAGTKYATLGKPFHTVPGQRVQLEMPSAPDVNPAEPGEQFHIYLPPMAMGDVVPLNPTADTVVGFGAAGEAQIRSMFASDPAKAQLVIDTMKVTYPAGSAQDENGVPATRATVIPVSPDRLPAPLPPGVNPQLVVSIQAGTAAGFNLAGGSTNFDVPAPVTFPNLDGLAPGDKVAIWSFDHDAGRWTVVGEGTVLADGRSVTSDPGIGVLAPGWHFIDRIARLLFGPPTDDYTCDDINKVLWDNFKAKEGTGAGALAYQLWCIANEGCKLGGFVTDVFRDIARHEQSPFYQALPNLFNIFSPLAGPLERACDVIPPDWVLIPGKVQTGDVCAVLSGFGRHFPYSLLPSFIANCPLDAGLHQQFFDDAVIPCFDKLHDLGYISDLGRDVAQRTVTATAGTLRDTVNTICNLLPGRPDFSGGGGTFGGGGSSGTFSTQEVTALDGSIGQMPVLPSGPSQVQLFSPELAATGTLSVRSSDFFLRPGNTYGLTVHRKSGGTEANLISDPGTQVYVFDADGGVVYSPGHGLVVRGTTSPLPNMTPMLYVMVRSGDDYGFGQFAIADVDTDGDIVVDSYERMVGTDPLRFNGVGSDLDGDGLSDFAEAVLGSNPNRADTDGDGNSDRSEYNNRTDILQPSITPPTRSPHYYVLTTGSSVVARGRTNNFGGLNDKLTLSPGKTYTIQLLGTINTQTSESGGTGSGGAGTVAGMALDLAVATQSFTMPMSGCLTLPPLELRYLDGPDTDADGLRDQTEFILGTSANTADTDGDGISDLAEIQQGLDPLGGRSFPTGVIASLALQGEAKSVETVGSTADATKQTAYVATGSYGLAVVDASKFQNPTVLGQLDLAGDATDVAVDAVTNVAVVAAGDGGLHFVNVADPMLPKLTRTASIAATQVEVFDGLAFAAANGRLYGFDAVSGEQLIVIPIGSTTAITGMAHEGNVLYTMDTERTVRAFQLDGLTLTPRGTLVMSRGGAGLAVAGGIVYAAAYNSNPRTADEARGGYATADFRDLAAPVELSSSDITNGAVPGQTVAVNGSGTLLLGGRARTSPEQTEVVVFDARDPSDTGRAGVSFQTQADPAGVSIASGIGYVATGAGGLQVVNYLSFDTQGKAPTVSISGPAGTTVDEGGRVPVRVTAGDDVQVRNVELLLNGQVVANDVSAPFELAAVMPTLASGAKTAKLQVRATDTGGNSTLSNELTYTLTPDSTSPTLLATTPANNGAGFQVDAVTLRFSEGIDPARVALTGFTLTNLGADNKAGGGDDTPVALDRVEVLPGNRVVVRLEQPAPNGQYRLTVDPSVLTDLAGNHLAAPVVTSFTSVDLDVANAVVWASPDGGDWNDPTNWSTGVVPGANDNVVINVLAKNITVTIGSGNQTVRSLVSREDLAITGGSLTLLGASAIEGRFDLHNGATLTASGPQASFVATSVADIDGGSVIATTGGTIQLPTVVSYTHAAGTVRNQVVLRASGVGSVLDLRNATSVTTGSGEADNILIEALAGGRMNLRSVTQVVDPLGGDARGRGTVVTADGVGSNIDLSALAQVTDQSAALSLGSNVGYSVLAARNGGTVTAPALADADGWQLVLDGTGVLPVARLRSFTDGSMTLSGAAYAFPALADADGTLIRVAGVGASATMPAVATLVNGGIELSAGGAATAPLLASVNGSSLTVSDGAVLTLPGVRSYTHTAGAVRDQVVLRASGVGSVLDLRNVASVATGSGNADNIVIEALAGGRVDLRAAVQITDPPTGDAHGRGVAVTADGNNSAVDLSALAQVTDQSAALSLASNLGPSTLTARNGGKLLVSAVQTFVTNTFVLTETLGQILGLVVLGPGSTREDR